MTFPLTLAGLLALFAAFGFGLHLAATFDAKKALAYRTRLAKQTPAHYQGREADFDKHGRTWG